jgi:hypothetical protein
MPSRARIRGCWKKALANIWRASSLKGRIGALLSPLPTLARSLSRKAMGKGSRRGLWAYGIGFRTS